MMLVNTVFYLSNESFTSKETGLMRSHGPVLISAVNSQKKLNKMYYKKLSK